MSPDPTLVPSVRTPDEAVLRWYVNTNAWQPSAAEFSACLGTLSREDQEVVQRFRFEDDRKRALVSRLLQRACVRHVCCVPDDAVELLRTKGKKPFTTNKKPVCAPNFNFNVSHEGHFTALASEPLCVCGIDVAAPQQLRRPKDMPLRAAIQGFKGMFAAPEWHMIESHAHDSILMETCFTRLWSLKEAFVKARGDGLGFEPLSRAQFCFAGGDIWSDSAELILDGSKQHRWGFDLQSLGAGHWVSVAKGPPEDIVDAHGLFKKTFGQPCLSDEDILMARMQPSPSFQELTVRQLLPPESIPKYMKAVAQEELEHM